MTSDASTPVLRRSMPRISPVSAIGLLLVLVLLAWLGENVYTHTAIFFQALLIGITNGCVYALIALGYTLVYGILELINFAHGDVFMLGGMFSITLAGHKFFAIHAGDSSLWPVIIVILIVAMACCAIINATIEFVAYRPLRKAPRLAPLITAIGMSFIVSTIGLRWGGPNPINFPAVLPSGSTTIRGVEITWTTPIVVMLTIPVLVGLLYLVQYTKQGKAMRATAQDMDASAIMGINVNRTISFTFFLAGALAGAAGLVFALAQTTVRYDQGFTLGLIAFTAAVLGGIGNLPGAVLGALLIGLIQAFNESPLWAAPGSDWTESIVFSILILILVFRPEGLLGERTPEGA